MLAYNLPSIAMVFVQPVADFTQALVIPLPPGFYQPGTLWKLQMSGEITVPSGTKLVRRVKFGDVIVSELTLMSRGAYPASFSDTLTIMFYKDNLFDVWSNGINSLTPPYELEADDYKRPRSALAELVASHTNMANPDRTLPISVEFWVEPIGSQVPVYLEQCTLVQVT